MVENVLEVKAAARLETVSLPNNAVKNRIEMSIDITNQVISGVKDLKFGFSMQLDKSTDIKNSAQLLVYVCYSTQDDDVKTELLMSKELSSPTKRKGYF